MNKAIRCFMGMFLMPLLAGAVTWQMDSNPFRWSGISTISAGASGARIVLQCKVDIAKGTVTIRYILPSGAKGAKLKIYSISGVVVKDFDLQSGSGTMQWNIARENVSTGIYVASVPYGGSVKKTVLAIVK
jgi:flagellar hook assembly protein FlgD